MSKQGRLLIDVAWAHAGDKGDMVNIGVVARNPIYYEAILEVLSPDRIKRHFFDICQGAVSVYALPNLNAVNVVLENVLDGGPMRSLRLDPQGKTLGDALLLLPIDDVI
ncbi:hypothetical protein [Cupriavidus necator]|uniref:AtuA-related protein n=1 Tax=Cupriavidus necator TaxID=106590 RepID=UPI0005B3455B|nr:hypothetical protein [Cupriavidus necator]